MLKPKVVSLNISNGGNTTLDEFKCEVVRSKRKTFALYIKYQKAVVRCPLRASKAEINEFVRKNHTWIQERLLEERLLEQEMLNIERSAKIFFRARELTIIFKEGRKQRILVNGNKFIIQGHKLTSAKAKIQVEKYLIEKANDYIIPRARALAEYLGVGKKITKIKLRKNKSKWGHCTSQGVIQYNWLIMLAPYSIIDYMITHEVCHLIYMDHSKHYWDLLESICPNYEHYIEWLKAHEHRFWFD